MNVQTGDEYLIPGHNKVSFLPDATIKELINKPYSHLTNASLDGDAPVKHEINPLDKLNEQAEEIKVIIAEIKDLNEPVVEAPKQVEIKEEKIEEPVAEIPEEIVTEVKAEVKEEVKTQAVAHNYPHESIQHAALSEKHELHERDIPIKPKRKAVKIILPLLLLLLILGGGGFYVQYQHTLIPEYKAKLKDAILSMQKSDDKPQPKTKHISTPKFNIEKKKIAPVDTIVTINSPKRVDTTKQVAKQVAPSKTPEVKVQPAPVVEKPKTGVKTQPQAKAETPKAAAIKKPEPKPVVVVEKPKTAVVTPPKKAVVVKPTSPKKSAVSVFDEPRSFNTTIATETMEKGSRLVLLAEKYYGNKDFWVYIYEANKSVMKTPGSVTIGMKIKVPKLNPSLIDLKNPECLRYAKTLAEKYDSK